MRVDTARLRGIGLSAGDGLQAQHFLPGPRPQRNAIGAGRHMQMDVEIGRRAKALDEGDRTGVSLAAFQSRLFDQKCGNAPLRRSPSTC